jgi:hypothetical protein
MPDQEGNGEPWSVLAASLHRAGGTRTPAEKAIEA